MSTNDNTPKDSAEAVAQGLEVYLKGSEGVKQLRPSTHPILPREGEPNYLITSALPYVNNIPHLGNIVGCVLSADVFARYSRGRGINVLYICGTDEYGTATETKALMEGTTPQAICDKYFVVHRDVYEWFQISTDFFGRTSTPKQTEICHDIFWRLQNRNMIEQDSVTQLFCEHCQRFLADRFCEGTCPRCRYEDARGDQCDKCGALLDPVDLINPRCMVCRTRPEPRTSKHLFLKLDQLQPPLEVYLDRVMGKSGEVAKKSEGSSEATPSSAEAESTSCWSDNARAITRTWLRQGLKSRCISRDLKWGTPVPLEGFEDKVFYVWFDAPIGYISITANYTAPYESAADGESKPKLWERWWKNPQQVTCFNFMAKDNVPFHSVIFPACLLGTEDNYTVVNELNACEYLDYEGQKFSKSRNVGVFGTDARITGIPSDYWRFYLLYVRPESQDTSFSWTDMQVKVNSELLNNVGNLINRVLSFIASSFQSRLPDFDETSLTEFDRAQFAAITNELRAYNLAVSRVRLRDGIVHVLAIGRIGNGWMQAVQPWALLKREDANDRKRAASVLSALANLVYTIALALEPYLPTTAATIKRQLNVESFVYAIPDAFHRLLPEGHQLGQPSPLFTKLDDKVIDTQRLRYGEVDTWLTEALGSLKVSAKEKAKHEAAFRTQAEAIKTAKANKVDAGALDAEVQKLVSLKHPDAKKNPEKKGQS